MLRLKKIFGVYEDIKDNPTSSSNHGTFGSSTVSNQANEQESGGYQSSYYPSSVCQPNVTQSQFNLGQPMSNFNERKSHMHKSKSKKHSHEDSKTNYDDQHNEIAKPKSSASNNLDNIFQFSDLFNGHQSDPTPKTKSETKLEPDWFEEIFSIK